MTGRQELPLVSLRSLGGTMAMTARGDGGVSPTLGASELQDAVPALRKLAQIDAASVLTIPSASLELTDVLDLRGTLGKACDSGARGVVVTQGTDTLEETSFLLDLLWDRPQPLVCTGAMRPADAPGADGPANLLAAVAVAASPQSAGRGCLVVMNDEIHLARRVRKLHTASTAAFGSPATGPAGRVQEGHVLFVAPPTARECVHMPDEAAVARVALLRVALGADTFLFEQAAKAYDGIVVEALGGGHVPAWWVEPLLTAAQHIPVVLASRAGAGPLLRSTYDFTGSERQLLAGGLIPAGELDGLKARILLTLAITVSAGQSEVAACFARHSQSCRTAGGP